MAIIQDRMIYLVTCSHRGGAYMPERYVSDLDRAETIKDIATGQISDVLQVLECNPVEGTCRDVTDDILAEAEASCRENGEVTPRDYRNWRWDHERDYHKNLVVL